MRIRRFVAGTMAALAGVGLVCVLSYSSIQIPIAVLLPPILAAAYWCWRAARNRRESAVAIERFEQLFHLTPMAVSLSRVDDRKVVDVNDAYLELFGIRRDQIVGARPEDAGIEICDHDRNTAFQHLRRYGSMTTPMTVRCAKGTLALTLWSRLVSIAGVQHALSTFVDVTERKHAEATARASDERLRELAETVQEVFWLSDPTNTKMHYISPSYERIFDRSCADLYADARDWLNAVIPEDRDRMVEFAITGQTSEQTYRIRRRDGTIRSILIKVFPICDGEGRLVRVAGVGQDITDRLVLEEQVRQTQKLESLGLLAGGVAHDFNNILAVIVANTSLLAETIGVEHPDRDLVDEIEGAVTRATALTRQLLAFSRKQVVEPVVLDVNAAVHDTRKMLRRMVGEDIVITTSLEPDLAHIRVDPNHLVQVLMNLVVNARDAMPRGGAITIATRSEGRDVVLSITDTGCGMTPEVMKRVFEPFFTTKGIGRGTGLGLSVVHGIVEQAGGRIELESNVDVGTCFRLRFPAVDAPVELVRDVASAGASGTEKVVLVDDDLFVRTSTSRALRARGYHVLEASDGQAALRLLRDHDDIDLLVTDVVMPGMDGPALVDSARQRRPSLKVLYISGYTDEAILHHGLDDRLALIEKPFRAHELAGRVRQVLDAAA